MSHRFPELSRLVGMALTPDAFAPWTQTRLDALNAQFEALSPRDVLDWATDTFGDDLVQGTSFGPSGIVIMHMLADLQPGATVFYIDTDLLFPETYDLRDKLDGAMDVTITRVHGGLSLNEQARREGKELWNSNPDRCCFLRKVRPLENYLRDKRAWITGVRRDQSPARANAPILTWEPRYSVLKVNPLATWTRKDVWRYLFDHDLPYNPKHDEGYPSLGCVPCTDPVEEETGYSRAGRWTGVDKTECGLHTSSNDTFVGGTDPPGEQSQTG